MDLVQQGSSSQNCSQNTILQDILLDYGKILYLLQCFQEAQDDRLCKNLLQMTFRESSINLANQILYPHHIISLGLFLSKSNHKWKRLNLARCHLEDEHFSHFHQYLCVKTNKSTVEVIDISDNDLTEVSSSLISDVVSHLKPYCLKLFNNHMHFAGLKQIFND